VIQELTEENTNLKHEVKGLKDNKTVLESEINSLNLKGKSDSGDLDSLRKKVYEGSADGRACAERERGGRREIGKMRGKDKRKVFQRCRGGQQDCARIRD
jgi:hypothetical protein